MSYPEIPDLPAAPLRSQPEEDYAAAASTFVGAMNPWGRAINAAGAWIQAAVADTFRMWQDVAANAATAQDQARMATEQVQAAAEQVHLASQQVTLASEQVELAAGQVVSAQEA